MEETYYSFEGIESKSESKLRKWWWNVCYYSTYCIPDRMIKAKDKESRREKMTIMLFYILGVSVVVGVFMVLPYLLCKGGSSNKFIFGNTDPFCVFYDSVVLLYSVVLYGVLLSVIGVVIIQNWRGDEYEFSESEGCYIHFSCYKETHRELYDTLESIVKTNYKRKKMMIVVDGVEQGEGIKTTDEILLFDILKNKRYIEEKMTGVASTGVASTGVASTGVASTGVASTGVVSTCVEYINCKGVMNRVSIYNGVYKGVEYIVLVKELNEGKRGSQLMVLQYLNREDLEITLDVNIEISKYDSNETGSFKYLMILDADTKIVKKMVSYMEVNEKCIGVCGETMVKNKWVNWLTITQSFEYWLSHKLIKNIESIVNGPLVLSGCFEMFKIRNETEYIINNNLINKYCLQGVLTMHERNLVEIGEDRYLTTLIISENSDKEYYLKYLEGVKCKTIVPDGVTSVVRQRRRWTNSLIHCHLEHIINMKKFDYKLIFLIVMEYFIVFVLPWVFLGSLVILMLNFILEGVSMLQVVFSVLVFLAPLIIVCIERKWENLIMFPIFVLGQFLITVYIPIDSLANSDNVGW